MATTAAPRETDAQINAARGKLAIDKKLGRTSSARVVAIAAMKTSNEKNDAGPRGSRKLTRPRHWLPIGPLVSEYLWRVPGGRRTTPESGLVPASGTGTPRGFRRPIRGRTGPRRRRRQS